ncbi:hypothetical protein LNV23_23570 [Paucibacter sp. DJ1R-11]|uniref:hypothetical protein n=1 Tax=Paucibacter sp. DJ1R-11 TaxID=2893556 RepID=UPI0021E37816|nr:hypothetical protein [Paucibacter sp. DJ1R-11]MCV2366420.1 hypothetical protein [Paucibacter sp. DJ1R-11]
MNIRTIMLQQFEANLRQLLQCTRIADAAGVELNIESMGQIPGDGWARLKAAELDQQTSHLGGFIMVAMFSGLVAMGLLIMIPMAKAMTAATRNEQTAAWAKEKLPKYDFKSVLFLMVAVFLSYTWLTNSGPF